MNFPITLKNTTKNKLIVGGLSFPPNDTLKIEEHVYLASKYYVDYALDKDILVVAQKEKRSKLKIEDVERVDSVKKVTDLTPEITLYSEEDYDKQIEEELEQKSIVDKFAAKEVHWTAVRKHVEESGDIKELESLLIDAQFHKLDEDSVIIRLINDAITVLTEKDQ